MGQCLRNYQIFKQCKLREQKLNRTSLKGQKVSIGLLSANILRFHCIVESYKYGHEKCDGMHTHHSDKQDTQQSPTQIETRARIRKSVCSALATEYRIAGIIILRV